MSLFNDSSLPEHAKYVQCPYHKAHMVPNSSFSKHLIKCRRSYVGPELKQCRFNVTHLTPPDEMAEHEISCKDRIIVERCMEGLRKRKPDPEPEEAVCSKRRAECDSDDEWPEDLNEKNLEESTQTKTKKSEEDNQSRNKNETCVKSESEESQDDDDQP